MTYPDANVTAPAELGDPAAAEAASRAWAAGEITGDDVDAAFDRLTARPSRGLWGCSVCGHESEHRFDVGCVAIGQGGRCGCKHQA